MFVLGTKKIQTTERRDVADHSKTLKAFSILLTNVQNRFVVLLIFANT